MTIYILQFLYYCNSHEVFQTSVLKCTLFNILVHVFSYSTFYMNLRHNQLFTILTMGILTILSVFVRSSTKEVKENSLCVCVCVCAL